MVKSISCSNDRVHASDWRKPLWYNGRKETLDTTQKSTRCPLFRCSLARAAFHQWCHNHRQQLSYLVTRKPSLHKVLFHVEVDPKRKVDDLNEILNFAPSVIFYCLLCLKKNSNVLRSTHTSSTRTNVISRVCACHPIIQWEPHRVGIIVTFVDDWSTWETTWFGIATLSCKSLKLGRVDRNDFFFLVTKTGKEKFR